MAFSKDSGPGARPRRAGSPFRATERPERSAASADYQDDDREPLSLAEELAEERIAFPSTSS